MYPCSSTCASITVSNALLRFVPSRPSPCGTRNFPFQPPYAHLHVGIEQRGHVTALNLALHAMSGYWSPLSPPPMEDGIQYRPAMIPDSREVQIEHVVQLLVEYRIVGTDRTVICVADAILYAAPGVRWIPPQVLISLQRVTVLQARTAALRTMTGGEHVSIIEFVVRISDPASPVLDLHRVGPARDSAHAVTTEPTLFCHQCPPQSVLVRIVVVVTVRRIAVRRQACRLRPLTIDLIRSLPGTPGAYESGSPPDHRFQPCRSTDPTTVGPVQMHRHRSHP